ncbi:hypothetical protein CLOLEP_02609 [[Clostridium] leptum DSM 753]|uniref:Uncharacterized protein n=1 Tax=[Clostridium] leptum DSM 753 TaxID=428125 RepID=A7VVJ7_9FIRM|nr:hypothetical protein CLOLEP_02609 [[Clostridium] leptum DSM 753]
MRPFRADTVKHFCYLYHNHTGIKSKPGIKTGTAHKILLELRQEEL